jgi:hypothetical protein
MVSKRALQCGALSQRVRGLQVFSRVSLDLSGIAAAGLQLRAALQPRQVARTIECFCPTHIAVRVATHDIKRRIVDPCIWAPEAQLECLAPLLSPQQQMTLRIKLPHRLAQRDVRGHNSKFVPCRRLLRTSHDHAVKREIFTSQCLGQNARIMLDQVEPEIVLPEIDTLAGNKRRSTRYRRWLPNEKNVVVMPHSG